MKVIYIAGPYDAMTGPGVRKNIERAREIAADCRRAGWVFYCPHTHTTGFDRFGDEPWNRWEGWMELDLAMLERYDAVLLIPGWEKSRGAKMERAHAQALGIPVFDFYKSGIPDPSEVG